MVHDDALSDAGMRQEGRPSRVSGRHTSPWRRLSERAEFARVIFLVPADIAHLASRHFDAPF